MTTKVNTNPLSNKFKPQSKIRVFTIPSTTPVHKRKLRSIILVIDLFEVDMT